MEEIGLFALPGQGRSSSSQKAFWQIIKLEPSMSQDQVPKMDTERTPEYNVVIHVHQKGG